MEATRGKSDSRAFPAKVVHKLMVTLDTLFSFKRLAICVDLVSRAIRGLSKKAAKALDSVDDSGSSVDLSSMCHMRCPCGVLPFWPITI